MPRQIAGALCSGVWLGCAFHPFNVSWIVWGGLLPLVLAIGSVPQPGRAFQLGWLAGLAFFLLTLYPFVSAQAWAGWIGLAEFRVTSTFPPTGSGWILHGLWFVFSCWGAVHWGVWAALVHRLGGSRPWRVLVAAPAAWILVAEWLRSLTLFQTPWAFLGYATADNLELRQLAALGGVWPTSALIVMTNVAVAQAWRHRSPQTWSALAAVGGLLAVAWWGGSQYLRDSVLESDQVVAALQDRKNMSAQEVSQEFERTGLSGRFPLMQEAVRRRVKLLVLPETITGGTTRLDNTVSRQEPLSNQTSRQAWDALVRPFVQGADTVLVVGLQIVEKGRDYNALLAWTRKGLVGVYRKRKLVPFSEYLPPGWGWLPLRSAIRFSPGLGSQLIRVDGLVMGGFICQEVMYPWLLRASVRDGATLLISGANDGVWTNSAVPDAQADAARFRAVETGRYILRATATGISAVLDPHGRELARSPSDAPVLLVAKVSPREGWTPYVRFGDWLLNVAALLLAWLALTRTRVTASGRHRRASA